MKNPFSFEDHRSRVRIIPQIDKMPRLIEWATTFHGKLAFLGMNLLLLWSFYLALPWSWVALCGFLVLAPVGLNWKFILALGWVAVFGLRDVEFGIWNFGELNRVHIHDKTAALYALLGDQILVYRLFILVACASLFFMMALIIKKFRLNWPLLWFILLWGLLLLIADVVPASSVVSVYAWGLFCIAARCFFGAIYLQLALKVSGSISKLTQFIFPLQGALLGTANNFLRSPTLLAGAGLEDPTESKRHGAVCLLKSTKLLLWTRLLTFFNDFINYAIYARRIAWLPDWASVDFLNWNDPIVMGFSAYNQLHVPVIQSWVAVGLHSFSFIILLSALSGVMIALIRMSGLYIPRDTCRPYAAQSFNDFLRRVLFYYSEILVHIFIFPVWDQLRFLMRLKKARLVATILISVGLCGWFTHMIFMPGYFVLSGGLSQGLHFYLMWLPYFILLSIACAISATGYLRKYLDPLIPQFLRMPLVFMFYSLLLVTAHGYPLDGSLMENWQARWVFIERLFGLG